MNGRDYRSLLAWKKAFELAFAIYKAGLIGRGRPAYKRID